MNSLNQRESQQSTATEARDMLIQINTDDNVNPSGTLTKWIAATAGDVLDRFADQVTRAEIHLSDL